MLIRLCTGMLGLGKICGGCDCYRSKSDVVVITEQLGYVESSGVDFGWVGVAYRICRQAYGVSETTSPRRIGRSLLAGQAVASPLRY